MGKVSVQYLPEVEDYLNDLTYLLFQKEYFGFLESSFKYVDNIVDFIEFNLSTFPAKRTPEHLLRNGSYYIFYKANANTTWFIFFEKLDHRYLVTYITNNHSEISKFL